METLLISLSLILSKGIALSSCYTGFNLSSANLVVPHLDPNAWWGPEEAIGHQDTSIRPFRIEFDEQMIQDLRQRLLNHRHFTPALEGVGFNYGFNSGEIETWLQYWAHEYPFDDRENYLNKYPMFKTNIQGLDIHFIRVKPQVPLGVQVVPLLMMHGWPGSIREFYASIPLLTAYPNGKNFAVELILPSLPGYGFSDAAVRPSMGGSEVAIIMRNLMRRLGHVQYYIQGGDFGAVIGSYMSTLYPQGVLGFHTNFAVVVSPPAILLQILGSFVPPLVVEPRLANRMYPLFKILSFLLEETGYLHEQATKPDTLGIGLSDSPAGLLAYILEKFSTATDWTNRDLADGGLEAMKKNDLIDNLMMYWVPNSMTTAMRLYAETFNKKTIKQGLDSIPTLVPTWVIQAKYELIYQSPPILRFKYPNLLNATALDFGGHFLAFQLPKVFSADVLEALDGFRRWHSKNYKGLIPSITDSISYEDLLKGIPINDNTVIEFLTEILKQRI